METIYQEMSVLESLRLPVEAVCVQVARIAIYYYSWRLFKLCAKDFKGVSWRLATPQDIKPITYPVRAIDGDNPRS